MKNPHVCAERPPLRAIHDGRPIGQATWWRCSQKLLARRMPSARNVSLPVLWRSCSALAALLMMGRIPLPMSLGPPQAAPNQSSEREEQLFSALVELLRRAAPLRQAEPQAADSSMARAALRKEVGAQWRAPLTAAPLRTRGMNSAQHRKPHVRPCSLTRRVVVPCAPQPGSAARRPTKTPTARARPMTPCPR